jgi:hypothetical protein
MSETAKPHAAESTLENWFGLSVALFAAILAISDLFAGRYGDDELKYTNEKTSAYLWYQSKGIKETLVEGQRDLLQSLVAAGAIHKDHTAAIEGRIGNLSQKVERYKKEKQEILAGSRNVAAEDHVQEVDGKLGKVLGALEMEKIISILGAAGDRFDVATLFLQISLVLGAIGLLMRSLLIRRILLMVMVTLGLAGAVQSTKGLLQAMESESYTLEK